MNFVQHVRDELIHKIPPHSQEEPILNAEKFEIIAMR